MENISLMRFDPLVVSLKEFLTHFSKSPELENFLLTRFTGFIYANLINNFFHNLNKKALGEFGLPQNKIKVIKNHFKVTLDKTRRALKFHDSSVDSVYYEKFKLDVRMYFPQFTIIIEVEKSFNPYFISFSNIHIKSIAHY